MNGLWFKCMALLVGRDNSGPLQLHINTFDSLIT